MKEQNSQENSSFKDQADGKFKKEQKTNEEENSFDADRKEYPDVREIPEEERYFHSGL